jgi:hypothetical protein
MSTASVKAIRSAAVANAKAAQRLVESIIVEKGPLSAQEVYDVTHRTHIPPPYPHSLLPPPHDPTETQSANPASSTALHPDHLIKSMRYLKMILKSSRSEGALVQSTASRWHRMQGGEPVRPLAGSKDHKFVWIPKTNWEQVSAVHRVQLEEQAKQKQQLKEERDAATMRPQETTMETATAVAAAAAAVAAST